MKHLEPKNRLCLLATIVFLAIYSVWRLGWTIPLGRGNLPVICWIILTVVEFIGLFELAVFLYEFTKKETRLLPKADPASYPDVDVFIFTINEPEDLLAKTIYACKKMKYPESGKVHIHLCDDGERATMQKLADQMGIRYLSRTEHVDAKAGNFNYAMVKTKSPLIAIFDADMMPKENFLTKTVPYFMADKKVGFVQTPQHFYRKDIFQSAFPGKDLPHNEQDYFYQAIQETRNPSNSVILAGSNTLLRRSAVEEIGGLVTGTLTEDFSTGIELQKKGYVGISIKEVLAEGLPPMDFPSLVKQRRRWAKGCIQSGKKTKYLRSTTLSVRQKMNYFSSISYWYSSVKRLIYFLAPMLFCLFGIGVMRCRPWQIIAFWLPMYIGISLCVYLFSGKIRSLYWTNIYETVLMPFLLPAVLKEVLGFHQKTFDVTAKKLPVRNQKESAKYMTPFLFLILLHIVSLLFVLYRSYIEAASYYVTLIVFLLINCYYLITACRIVSGNTEHTEDDLLDIQETVQYKDDSEDAYVTIKTAAMGEDTVRTGIYDETWTHGVMRFSHRTFAQEYMDIPVQYEKNGNWKLDISAISLIEHQEYIYHLFNR